MKSEISSALKVRWHSRQSEMLLHVIRLSERNLVKSHIVLILDKKDSKGHAIWSQIPRDLDWLWKPIEFKRPQLDLQRGRDWSYLSSAQQLSLNTLQGRKKVSFVCKGFDQYLDADKWKFGSIKLLQSKQNWYVHISATTSLPEYSPEEAEHVVGIDRGLHFLAACYDEAGKTLLYSGEKVLRTRRKYKKLRAELQSKGTKSAKRRLKQIGQRENRWMSDVNHCLTKTLIDHYGANTVFALEDLTDVRFATEQTAKDKRYEMVSWAFYQFEQFLCFCGTRKLGLTFLLPHPADCIDAVTVNGHIETFLFQQRQTVYDG